MLWKENLQQALLRGKKEEWKKKKKMKEKNGIWKKSD